MNTVSKTKTPLRPARRIKMHPLPIKGTLKDNGIYDDKKFMAYLKKHQIEYRADADGGIHLEEEFFVPHNHDAVDITILRSCKDILEESNIKKMSFKGLKTAGDIHINYTKSLNFPDLEVCNDIYAYNAKEANFKSLKKCNHVDMYHLHDVVFPCLEKGENIYVGAHKLVAPKLKESGFINAKKAEIIYLPELVNGGSLEFPTAQNININSLKTTYNVKADALKIFYAPELEYMLELRIEQAEYAHIPKLKKLQHLYAGKEMTEQYKDTKSLYSLNAGMLYAQTQLTDEDIKTAMNYKIVS